MASEKKLKSAAAELGRKGGRSKSAAKAAAARANGKKGGCPVPRTVAIQFPLDVRDSKSMVGAAERCDLPFRLTVRRLRIVLGSGDIDRLADAAGVALGDKAKGDVFREECRSVFKGAADGERLTLSMEAKG